LWYGGYKVVLYRVVDESIVSPVFPTDYAMVRTWLQDGVPVPVVPPVSMYTVGTIAELSALDPADVDDVVTVLGYYASTDNVEPRSYAWVPASTATNDGGSVIPASGYATGRWVLKSPSPVVDVRWFGALPNTAIDCNSAFVSAAAYAYSSGSIGASKTLHFPAGSYQVAPGSLTVSGSLSMSLGVSFFVRIAGDFALRVNGRFRIDTVTVLLGVGSIGTLTPDFTSNVGLDTVNEAWWSDGLEGAIPNAGTCPILVQSVQTVAPLGASYDVSKLIIRGVGEVEFQASANDVTILQLDAPQGTAVITTTGGAGTAGVAFKGIVYISNLTSAVVMYAHGSDASLLVDKDTGLTLTCTLNWGSIVGMGGALLTQSGKTTTVGPNVQGAVHSCAGTVLGNADVSTFFLTDSAEVNGYIRSAMAVDARADFGGRFIAHNIDLEEFDAVEIHDAYLSGILFRTTGTNQVVKMSRCSLASSTSGEYVGLILEDCTWAQIGSTETFRGGIKATDCTLDFTGTIIGSDITLTDCETILTTGKTLEASNVRIDGGSFSGSTTSRATINPTVSKWVSDCHLVNISIAMDTVWDIFAHDNRFSNSFIVFSGTVSNIANIDIKDNEFINSAGLALYEPLNIDAAVVSGSGGNCVVSGNIPANPSTVKKVSGIAVRQTNFRVKIAAGTGSSLFRSLETADQNYAFAPFLEDGRSLGFGLHTASAGTVMIGTMYDPGGGNIGYEIAVVPAEETFVEMQIY
jgi:hypothetical protein